MKACDRFEWQRALLSSDECMQHSMKIGVRVITTAAIFSTRKKKASGSIDCASAVRAQTVLRA